MTREERYIIIKKMKSGVSPITGEPIIQNVLLINNLGEVEEFDDKERADKLCELLNCNTDSGHLYVVKEI